MQVLLAQAAHSFCFFKVHSRFAGRWRLYVSPYHTHGVLDILDWLSLYRSSPTMNLVWMRIGESYMNSTYERRAQFVSGTPRVY